MNIAMYKEPDLDDVLYPEWAKSLGWLIAMFPIVVIPAWFLYKYCRIGGFEVSTTIIKQLDIYHDSERLDCLLFNMTNTSMQNNLHTNYENVYF